MFGIINEALLNNLENTYLYLTEGQFKKKFNKYAKTILENNTIREFYNIYQQFKTLKFDNELIATQYLDECLKHLNKFDKTVINGLLTLVEGESDVVVDDYIESLDQLVFNEGLTPSDRAEYKVKLIKHLINKEAKTSDNVFDTLHEKVTKKIDGLNVDQKRTIELFIENDNQKITDFYLSLINETRTLIDKKIIESDDSNIIKKLTEVTMRLSQLKDQPPLIEEIEKIIELKESF